MAREQNGYEAGNLSAVSVSNDGVLIGAFTNGVKKDLATLAAGPVPQPRGSPERRQRLLRHVRQLRRGRDPPRRCSTGAGTIHGSALEKSNADVATEFVTLIEAQNGFQANARTIRVANDILRELTSLIR